MYPSLASRPGDRSRRGRVVALLAALVLATPLLTAATSGPAAGQDQDEVTLTVQLIDHRGQAPCDGCIRAVDAIRDTAEYGEANGHYTIAGNWLREGKGVFSLPVQPGVYTFYGTLFRTDDAGAGYGTANPSAHRQDHLIKLEIPVYDDTTVVLDARDGVLTSQPRVPETDVQVRHQAFAFFHWVAASNSWFPVTILDCSGNEFVRFHPCENYVTPFPDWQLQPTHMWEHWILGEPQPLEPGPIHNGDPKYYSPTPAWMYRMGLLYDHGVSAADLAERSFTAGQFVSESVHYHADQPDTIIGTVYTPRSHHSKLSRAGEPRGHIYFEPGEVTEYYLADDRFMWDKGVWQYYGPDPGASSKFTLSDLEVFPTSEAGTQREAEDWFQAPHTHGAGEADPRVQEAFRSGDYGLDEGAEIIPGMARNGSDFYPPHPTLWNSGPQGWGSYWGHMFKTSWRMWNADTGDELPHQQKCSGALILEECQDLPYLFTGMADESATYRLEQTDAYPEWMEPYFRTKPSGTSTTVWTFASARSDAQLPPEYECVPFNFGTDCQIQPLIQIKYDLGLDTFNQAPAGRAHVFTLEAKHHVEAVDRAEVTEFSVQASFDDGEAWQTLPAAPVQGEGSEGRYRVTVKHPKLADTSGFVSLRVQATDANGGTVDQTVCRAYILEGAKDDEGTGCVAAQAPVEGSVTTAATGAPVRAAGVTSQFVEFEVPEGVHNARAEVVAAYAQAANIDLYLQRQNSDGTWGSDLASGTSVVLDGERMTTGRLFPGTYRVEVHNWAGPPANEVAVTTTFFNSAGQPGT